MSYGLLAYFPRQTHTKHNLFRPGQTNPCNGLENVSQSAYKQGHSTETALLSIKNEVHLALARGEATAVVLLDNQQHLTPLIMVRLLSV